MHSFNSSHPALATMATTEMTVYLSSTVLGMYSLKTVSVASRRMGCLLVRLDVMVQNKPSNMSCSRTGPWKARFMVQEYAHYVALRKASFDAVLELRSSKAGREVGDGLTTLLGRTLRSSMSRRAYSSLKSSFSLGVSFVVYCLSGFMIAITTKTKDLARRTKIKPALG